MFEIHIDNNYPTTSHRRTREFPDLEIQRYAHFWVEKTRRFDIFRVNFSHRVWCLIRQPGHSSGNNRRTLIDLFVIHISCLFWIYSRSESSRCHVDMMFLLKTSSLLWISKENDCSHFQSKELTQHITPHHGDADEMSRLTIMICAIRCGWNFRMNFDHIIHIE